MKYVEVRDIIASAVNCPIGTAASSWHQWLGGSADAFDDNAFVKPPVPHPSSCPRETYVPQVLVWTMFSADVGREE